MFPTILQQLQQHQEHESMHDEDDPTTSSIQSVPTPSNSPSPPLAHLSPLKSHYPRHPITQPSQHSTLMQILSKPPLHPEPPAAHTRIALARPVHSVSQTQRRHSNHEQDKIKLPTGSNENPYGSINRLQLFHRPSALPPPQSAPEDLRVNKKIARKLSFVEESQAYPLDDNMLNTREQDMSTQETQLILNTIQTKHNNSNNSWHSINNHPLDSLSVGSRGSISGIESNSSSSGGGGGSGGQHECQDCGKVYSTSSNLARHRQTHR